MTAGEINIVEGVGRTGLIQMVSSNSSCSAAEIAAGRVSPSQPIFFQLYKPSDPIAAEKLVRETERLGYSAIFLTVDALVPGNREKDVRAGWQVEEWERIAQGGEPTSKADIPRTKSDLEEAEESVDTRGTAGALIAHTDIDMTWKTVSCLVPRFVNSFL